MFDTRHTFRNVVSLVETAVQFCLDSRSSRNLGRQQELMWTGLTIFKIPTRLPNKYSCQRAGNPTLKWSINGNFFDCLSAGRIA